MFPSEVEIEHTQNLTQALQVIAFAATKIGARDMNLAMADEIFEFAFEQLEQLASAVALEMLDAMRDRIVERKLKGEATLLAYLQNPKFLIGRKKKLEYSNKTDITDVAVSLYTRLFHKEKQSPTEPVITGQEILLNI